MPRPNRSGGAIGLSIATLKGASPTGCQPSSSSNRQDARALAGGRDERSICWSDSSHGGSHRFLRGQNGAGRYIAIAQIRESLEFGLGSYSEISPDLHFLLLVQTAIFASFSTILI
jgi:hypothetical protein